MQAAQAQSDIPLERLPSNIPEEKSYRASFWVVADARRLVVETVLHSILAGVHHVS